MDNIHCGCITFGCHHWGDINEISLSSLKKKLNYDRFQTEGCWEGFYSSGRSSKMAALSKRIGNLENQVTLLQQDVAALRNANSHSNNGGNQAAKSQQANNNSSKTT